MFDCLTICNWVSDMFLAGKLTVSESKVTLARVAAEIELVDLGLFEAYAVREQG
jgi:hypothetical protein